MWTLSVAVAVGGIGVDANLRMVQVIGSPEDRFLTWFSSPLAPASRPGVSKAFNSRQTLGLGEFPTEPVTREAHPYPHSLEDEEDKALNVEKKEEKAKERKGSPKFFIS
ncbi:hypothetical protein Taro_033014 [Colocasia esculenta]|uniref:Uncharacterized protein n=1 Tax=Colocasia esculenta TaxID=4460 RepID=A0A843W5M7_COLES|nr:hypothetical protein [Colocasia esculenta]